MPDRTMRSPGTMAATMPAPPARSRARSLEILQPPTPGSDWVRRAGCRATTWPPPPHGSARSTSHHVTRYCAQPGETPPPSPPMCARSRRSYRPVVDELLLVALGFWVLGWTAALVGWYRAGWVCGAFVAIALHPGRRARSRRAPRPRAGDDECRAPDLTAPRPWNRSARLPRGHWCRSTVAITTGRWSVRSKRRRRALSAPLCCKAGFQASRW